MTNEDRGLPGFDLEALRLDDSGNGIWQVGEAPGVAVRKPRRDDWVRVHQEWTLKTQVVEAEQRTYLIAPELQSALREDLVSKVLLPAVNRAGEVFLWPIRLPRPDGTLDPWNGSALNGARRARGCWVRLVADHERRGYRVLEAEGEWSDPEWPANSLQGLLDMVDSEYRIDSLDHPVAMHLRGKA